MLLGIYIPLVVLASLCAAWSMDNLACAANDEHAMRDVLREPHTWSMSFLYVGTFGSFIGFSFAFGQVLQVQFSATFDTPLKAAYLTFLGPLIGSLIRPVGGRLADRFGGTRVSIVNFVLMGIGAGVALVASRTGSLGLFLAAFIALFTLSGFGNGSTYKMIPAIFADRARRQIATGRSRPAAEADARRLSRALIGVAGATGAFGGVLVNLALRESFLHSGRGDAAYVGFIAYYAACVLLAWVVYQRPASRRAVIV